ASPRDTHPTACPPANAHHRRRLSDTPHTTRNPTAGAAIHASTNRPASPGDNHGPNPRPPPAPATPASQPPAPPPAPRNTPRSAPPPHPPRTDGDTTPPTTPPPPSTSRRTYQ